MNVEREGESSVVQKNVWQSIFRSVFNQYWKYSFLPVSSATIGTAIASVNHSWDFQVWGLTVLVLWILDQGMKSLDLSEEDINLVIDSRVQMITGWIMIGAGIVLAIVLSMLTTLWLLCIIAACIILGLAYNLEWFDGRLHDREYLTGWGNLGFILGWLSTVLGYVALAESISVGIAVFAVGPMLSIGAIAWVEQDLKPEIYDAVGIEYTRAVDRNMARLRRRVLHSQLLRVAGFVAMAAGLVIEFVPLA